jgi:alpha-L-fucosidase 2
VSRRTGTLDTACLCTLEHPTELTGVVDRAQGPPSTWEKALFGGNAMLGFMMWQPDNETVRIDLGRADLYDDRTKAATPEAFTGNFVYDRPRLPIGHLLLRFGAPIIGGSGRLNLWNAEAEYNVTTQSNGGGTRTTSVRIWASADHELADAVVVDIGGARHYVDVRWVPEPGDSFWMPRNSKYVPNPTPRTVTNATRASGTLNVTTQMHLRGTAHSTAVLRLADSAGIILSVSPVSKSDLDADAWATEQVSNAAAAGIDKVRTAHRAWWHVFWPAGGFVTYELTVMESLYLLMQYKFASAARRGRAFMDLNGPWLVSVDGGTNAPDVHWDWNIQGMYYMPFLTNRPEIANSLVDYVEDLLRSGVLWSSWNVQPGWEDSAAAPTGASGLDGQQSCYWNYGVNCTVSPPSVTGNLLWTLHVVHQAGIYQGNETVSSAVVWPLLCRALRFYGHFMIENSTHITLPPTFSPEYPGPAGPNANYDLALLRWGVRTAAHLTKQHQLPALPSDTSLWQRLADKLIGPSLDDQGRFAIYEGTPYAKPHRHFSHLLPLWPLRELSNLSDAIEHRQAVASVDLWSSMPELFSLFGRPACASMNADLGRYAAALDNISYFVRTRVEGSGWYWEGAATACNEAPYMAAYTLADWLLQSWNETLLAGPGLHGARVKVIEPFRGIPDVVRLDGSAYDAAPAAVATGSFYKLAAEGGFLVSAVRDRVNPNDTSVYEAKTRFIAVESTRGGPCVLRTSMQRPLRSHPASVQLKDLGECSMMRQVLCRMHCLGSFSSSGLLPDLQC